MKKFIQRVMNVSPVKFLIRVFGEFAADDGSTIAAGLAYYSFLALFPLILAVIGIVGLVLPSEQVREQIFMYVREQAPWAADLIQTNIENVIRLRGTLGTIGLLGLLLSGSGFMGALGHAINRVWDIDKELQFYLKKPRDIALTVALSILFLLSFAAGAVASVKTIADIPLLGSAISGVAGILTALVLSFIIFLILFKIMPNTRTYWRHIWFGALLTAVLFEIGRYLTLYYFTRFANYQIIYGSIGSAVALLVWIYYSSTIVLIGAEFTAEYGRMRRGISRAVHSTAKSSHA